LPEPGIVKHFVTNGRQRSDCLRFCPAAERIVILTSEWPGSFLRVTNICTALVDPCREHVAERVPVDVFKPGLAAGFLQSKPEVLKSVSSLRVVEDVLALLHALPCVYDALSDIV
jgi:hypothetical protein